MRFYHFGEASAPAILLLPGTCCHWKSNFESAAPLLEPYFHVVCASYDGFDETEPTVFPDMRAETEKLEAYIQERFGGRIRAAYGCSLGGSFVGLLVQRRRVHIDHGILGSSDLDQAGRLAAGLQARMVANILYGMFQKGRLPGFMARRLQNKPPEERAYYDSLLSMFGVTGSRMAFVKKQSIRNQFYSDLVTPLEEHIAVPGTTVHCFYVAKMGEKYLDRYFRHFQNPVIHRHDMQHEELLLRYPQRWAEEVRRSCLEG